MHTETLTRTDYTFKYNSNLGRHGWLRLTPAYSVKLVREIIKKDCPQGGKILDPFSGSGTTGLVAAELGFTSILFDINPFLIWLGNTKCYHFSAPLLSELNFKFKNSLNEMQFSNKAWTPPIFNIERWWHPDTLMILANIRSKIVEDFGEPDRNSYSDLVWISFSRLIIETSSAAFNHVSMSFKSESIQYGFLHIKSLFENIFSIIIDSAKIPLLGQAEVIKCDSRNLLEIGQNQFDIVITSPPYPNRMSYIRELRPYMYWVKFLSNGNDAAVLDWEAIGGTWGIATSNLKLWQPVNKNLPQDLYTVCEKIYSSGDKNSNLMANYVHKYFDDIFSHLLNIKGILKPDARLNYIVGNSSFYGIFVNTESLFAKIFEQLDYKNIKIETIRKRNTKKGLLEFNVSAQL